MPKRKYRALYSGHKYDTYEEAVADNARYKNDILYRYWVKSGNFARTFGHYPTVSYSIPFIESKRRTLSNAGLATGAVISENMLDTIAAHAEKVGLPIKTALGIATKESTLGNWTDDGTFHKLFKKGSFNHRLYRSLYDENGTIQHINPGIAIDERELINFHDERNPYKEAIKYADENSSNAVSKQEWDNDVASAMSKTRAIYVDMLSKGENYADNVARRLINTPKVHVLDAAFTRYKNNPNNYNPGQANYSELVDKRGNEVWSSPEVQNWWVDYNKRKRQQKRFGGRLSLKGGGATTASLAFMVPRELRRKLYKHINPYGDYHILGNYQNLITKAEPDYGNIVKKDGQYFTEYQDADSNIGIVDDIWAKYLNIPRNESHYFRGKLQKSKYRPTKGGSRFTTYYKLPLTDEEKANIVYQTDGLKLGQNLVSEELAQYNLGQHTVGRGKDKRGEYRSYYDRWDLNPFIDKYQGTRVPVLENIGDMSFGLGKPVHIYDRIYMDDYYGVPRQGATYLPELEIWSDDENLRFGYRNGGRISLKYGGIHINPANRGKFTETMRRTGKTAEELSHSKNPLTRKRAIFALNARKWKH